MCGGPRLGTLEIVIIRIESHQVDGQLAPGNELVQECFLILVGSVGFLYGQRDGKRTDMSEMQIGREPAGSDHLRPIAFDAISTQAVRDEFFQKPERFVGAAAKV